MIQSIIFITFCIFAIVGSGKKYVQIIGIFFFGISTIYNLTDYFNPPPLLIGGGIADTSDLIYAGISVAVFIYLFIRMNAKGRKEG